MAMEAHKLRFVRCPRCTQVLIEYPSIPVYKCGGCGAVLKAKNRAVPAEQAGSRSDEQGSFPSSLKGSPQSSRSICSDEHRAVSSVDRPSQATADGSMSSTINDIESRDVADKRPNAETGSVTVIDGDIQLPGVMVNEAHDKDTRGTDSSSDLTEKGGNLDTIEIANEGDVNNFDTREMSAALYEKADVVHGEEKMHTCEGTHVESHESLIEELERSLSFSSDDDYFSDEAENSGLSDALRNQMGSRRFMLGGKTNDASRSDPHGRLIEELEMSFSDAEDQVEQHAAVVGIVHGNEHDKNPQTLCGESAYPCEKSLSLFDNEHLKCEQTSHQENRLIDKDIKVKKESHTEEKSTANNAEVGHTEENSTANYAEEGIVDISHESGKDWQSVDMEIAHPCEGNVSSFDDSNFKDHRDDTMEECHAEDDSTADLVNENTQIVVADEGIAKLPHEKGKDLQFTDAESPHPFEGSVSLVDDGNDKFKQSFQPNDLTADATLEVEECCMEDDNGSAHPFEGSVYFVDGGNDKFDQSLQPNDLTADATQETEEYSMEDDNMNNYAHGTENLVFSDDISENVNGNQELMADCCTGENEKSHVEDDNMTNIIDVNQNIAVTDEHTEERVDKNEHGKDQQSLEEEGAYLGGVLSSFNTRHVESEQKLQQNELTTDVTKEKEEADMDDGYATATVANFSSLSYKRKQYKVPSFNNNKQDIPYGYKASQLRQGMSLDSEDFKSVQNFIESQIDGTSSSHSSGSPNQGGLVHSMSNKFNNIVGHERLKKMDELRDQLSRLSSHKGSEKSYQKRDLEYLQQSNSNSYDIEQHFQSVDGDSMPSSGALESYYGHGRPPRYQPPNPFSPTHTYTHCHFGHAQARMPHHYDPWEFNSYYQSSYAESTIHDHESLRSSYKEQKRVVRKHILRPLSGASPYTICNSCFNLVQMPSDIYISKAKIGKMQCGKCSRVLALSFASVHQADSKTSMDVAQQPYNPDDSITTKGEDIASYYAECLAGGPISINEEYGASIKTSLSTQAGSSLAATQSGKKVSDSALHRLMGYDSASQLLRHSRVFEDGYERRHSRVFEDGYESFESMVPVSSRISRRKNK